MPRHAPPVNFREDRFRLLPFWANDFTSTTAPQTPFLQTAIASGTTSSPASGLPSANHPGQIRIISSTSSNSGAYVGTNTNQLLLGGGEVANVIFNLNTLALSTFRMGFVDTASASDETDGCYVEIDSSGVATGKTANNSSRSSTATTTTLSASTWYRLKVELNAAASLVTFTIYSDAGAVLWTDTLSSNIPTASGRETGVGIVATNSGTSAVDLVHIDYLALAFTRVLQRGGI